MEGKVIFGNIEPIRTVVFFLFVRCLGSFFYSYMAKTIVGSKANVHTVAVWIASRSDSCVSISYFSPFFLLFSPQRFNVII